MQAEFEKLERIYRKPPPNFFHIQVAHEKKASNEFEWLYYMKNGGGVYAAHDLQTARLFAENNLIAANGWVRGSVSGLKVLRLVDSANPLLFYGPPQNAWVPFGELPQHKSLTPEPPLYHLFEVAVIHDDRLGLIEGEITGVTVERDTRGNPLYFYRIGSNWYNQTYIEGLA